MSNVAKRLNGSRCHYVMEAFFGHIVLDGKTQLPHKGHSSPPQFSAGVYCGQMAGWIKMPLGTKVGLSAGDIVLDDTYRWASASSRVLYCEHSIEYSHVVSINIISTKAS